jgi:diacylglycerol O-acyltransferase-1
MQWWTASSLGEFWRRWNWPVHIWAERHLLIEAQVYLHVTRRGGVAITFFVSALLHELVLGFAFRTLRPFFFFAMLLQLPLIAVSHLMPARAGNVFVWLSLWLGQPLLHLLYARDFMHRGHGAQSFFCLE